MGRLKHILIILMLSQFSDSKTEVPEELNWYRQIELNLTDSFIMDGKDIPSNIRDWPIIKQEVLSEGKSGLFFMRMSNRLALVPRFPVISCFENTSARKHNGSRVIAISRDPVKQENQTGRYALLQTSDPESVWVTWLAEEDARTLFKSLDDFNPSIQPLPFPEVRDRENSERLAAEREQKAIQQIVKERDFRENNRKPTSVGREGKKQQNPSDGNETDKESFNLSIWVILSVVAGILMVWLLSLMRKKSSS